MRRTALRGHALRGEGNAYVRGDEEPWIRARGWDGHGLCECGEVSPSLDTNNARKRWHAKHKNEIAAIQAGEGTTNA